MLTFSRWHWSWVLLWMTNVERITEWQSLGGKLRFQDFVCFNCLSPCHPCHVQKFSAMSPLIQWLIHTQTCFSSMSFERVRVCVYVCLPVFCLCSLSFARTFRNSDMVDLMCTSLIGTEHQRFFSCLTCLCEHLLWVGLIGSVIRIKARRSKETEDDRSGSSPSCSGSECCGGLAKLAMAWPRVGSQVPLRGLDPCHSHSQRSFVRDCHVWPG